MCAGAGAGAVNFQILGAGAVSAPAPALRGLVGIQIIFKSYHDFYFYKINVQTFSNFEVS